MFLIEINVRGISTCSGDWVKSSWMTAVWSVTCGYSHVAHVEQAFCNHVQLKRLNLRLLMAFCIFVIFLYLWYLWYFWYYRSLEFIFFKELIKIFFWIILSKLNMNNYFEWFDWINEISCWANVICFNFLICLIFYVIYVSRFWHF